MRTPLILLTLLSLAVIIVLMRLPKHDSRVIKGSSSFAYGTLTSINMTSENGLNYVWPDELVGHTVKVTVERLKESK